MIDNTIESERYLQDGSKISELSTIEELRETDFSLKANVSEKIQSHKSELMRLVNGQPAWKDAEEEAPEVHGLYLCFHNEWGIYILDYGTDGFEYIGLGNDKPEFWMDLPKPPNDKA